MKRYIAILKVAILIISCNQTTTNKDNDKDIAFAKAETQQSPCNSYGAKIEANGAIKSTEVVKKYTALKSRDRATIKLEEHTHSVDAAKGCWRRLTTETKEVFVPLYAEGETVVEGKAYLEVVYTNELQHTVEDAGNSKEEIAAITKPKSEIRFMAERMLINSKI